MIHASFCIKKGIFLFPLYRNLKTTSSGKAFFWSFIKNFMFLFWRIGCYARLNYYWKPSFCNTQLWVWNVPFYYKILDSASHLSYRANSYFLYFWMIVVSSWQKIVEKLCLWMYYWDMSVWNCSWLTLKFKKKNAYYLLAHNQVNIWSMEFWINSWMLETIIFCNVQS